MKENIAHLKQEMVDAKTRQSEAASDIKTIEKDMKEFSNNKDNKLAELQTSLDTLKKGLSKHSVAVKTSHKEVQNARLESDQAASDLSAAEEQLAEADSTLKAQKDEVEDIQREQAKFQVCEVLGRAFATMLTIP